MRRRDVLALAALSACKRTSWTPPDRDPTSRALVKPYVPGAESYATHEERWITSACAQCPAACGIRVRVVEGRAVRIEASDHPFGSACPGEARTCDRGGIGVRGLSGLQTLYDPDRITQPLRRIGDRLVPTTWDAALSTLATALARVRARAPEQLFVMSGLGRGFTHDLLARFACAFGTPSFIDGSRWREAPLARAMELSLGTRTLPAYGWEHTGAILSLEAGLFEDACSMIARVVAAMRRDRSHRARIVHAGPRFDLGAYNADRWLRIAPGTSGALALGVCRVLSSEIGDRAFRAFVDDFTPERVAAITGCERGDVEALASELWERRPVSVLVDERSLAFTNGIDTARAAIALSAVLGSIENPRGGLRLAPSAPICAWPALDELAAPASPMPDGAEVALLYHANPGYTRAQPARWRDALDAVPLVVSFSPFLDETVASVVDLVLPDHTYLERFEDATPAPGTLRAAANVRKPAVAPLHDTRATADVILDLARRLGDPITRALPWRTPRDAFEERWIGLHTAARGTIVEPTQRAFFERFYAAGGWADERDAAPEPVDVAYPTTWSPPAWDGDPARFPLALLAYRPLGHEGANQPWLRALPTHPGAKPWRFAATLAPGDAPPGVKTGDRIRVTSPHGAVELEVQLDPRIARGCIAIPMGGGHTGYGRYARGVGANVMELLGSDLLCATRVRVEALS